MYKGRTADELLSNVGWLGLGDYDGLVTAVPMSVEGMGHAMEEEDMLTLIGRVAGECYGSSMDRDRCVNRAVSCVTRGHHSPFEHYNVTLKCTVDRGTSHALVRHRHCAFQQSSTIYQRYGNAITVVAVPDKDPCDPKYVPPKWDPDVYRGIKKEYDSLLAIEGVTPASARDVLPNSLAASLIITTNIRQWMWMIQRRVGPGDSARMHIWALLVRRWFEERYPRTVNAFDQWYDSVPM